MKKLMRIFKEVRRIYALGEISEEVFEACRYDVICAWVQGELARVAAKKG
jgi:hypothetical protein